MTRKPEVLPPTTPLLCDHFYVDHPVGLHAVTEIERGDQKRFCLQ